MPSWLLQSILGGLGALALIIGSALIDLRGKMEVVRSNQEMLIRWVHDTDKARAGWQVKMAEQSTTLDRVAKDVEWLISDKQRQFQRLRDVPPVPHASGLPQSP